MANVHFIDTSFLVEMLDIPGKNAHRKYVFEKLNDLEMQNDVFVIPIAALIETGNHIAHIRDGEIRYKIAEKFSNLIKNSLSGDNNWNLNYELTKEILNKITSEFTESAKREVGFGDISIIEQFEEYWAIRQPIGSIDILSLDAHLAEMRREGGLKRRKSK